MPRRYAKKKKKYVPRRKVRRRRPVRNANMLGFVSGMPAIRRAYLRYSDNISIASSAGILNKHVFRANGPWDPDVTATGHQPMGFDQWAILYNHMVVVGAKITIKWMSNVGIDIYQATGVYISDDLSVPYTSVNGFIEAKRGTWRTVTTQRNSISMHTNFSTKKFFNLTDVKDNISRVGSSVDALPPEQAYFNLWYQNVSGGTTSADFQVVIDYIVDYSEPKDLVQS